ncbi:MAG: glycosyltransferase [Fibromonadales bacterium]|nr:glycosyltransferase [Fibromonadales bacterium]
MLTFFVFLLALAYSGLMIYLWRGLLSEPRFTEFKDLPDVSVIIPMRNEEAFIEVTLNALKEQKYAGKWEAIVVNDRSTDKSPDIARKFCENNPNFSVIDIPQDSPQIASPKKRAMNAGFLAAKGEFLLIADADCVPPPNWLASMAACYASGASVVQGSKANNGSNRFLHSYQKLETLGFTLIEAAGFNRNKPILASSASIGYSKELFFKCGGFEGLYDLTSGDDDMLIHRMAKIEGTKFAYNWDPSSIMPTAPVDSWKALLQQRARWGSNGANYESKAYSAFLFCIYAFFASLFILPWICWQLFLFFFAIKFLADFLLLYRGAARLKSVKLLWCLPLVELIQIPLFTAAVPLGMLGWYKWK